VFHPQPWVLTRRTLQDPHPSSDKVPDTTAASSQQTRSQERGDENDGYLVYSTGSSQEDGVSANGDSNEGARFRSQENPSDSREYHEDHQIEHRQRSRYRDEPMDGMYVEDDEDLSYDFRQQSAQGYSDHSPHQYGDEGGNNNDGYNDQEGSYDELDGGNAYGNNLQLETNVEPYDDEVAAKEDNTNSKNNNNNQDETYSLEYTQSDLDSDSNNSNKNSDSNNANNGSEKSEKSSSESNADNNSQAKGDDGSDSEEDDYYNDDDDYESDEYQDDQVDHVYDSGGGKGKKGGGNQKKKVTAPFWGPHDYALGSHKGQGWAVQGPPVYFQNGEGQWPPDNGRGRKGGKGGKGKKGKGKKGKKGGGREKKGWHHGWGGWENIGNGGWGQWPKGWISGNNLDTGGQRWVEGKGWTGGTGAPWIPKKDVPHHWGFPLGWKMEERGRGGKKGKGKGGKKGKKKGKGKKGKKGKKKCKKRKGRGGKGGKGKKGKKGGGCETGWGWPKPHFLKLKPIPPRGSQVWLKPGGGWPQKPIGGWHPTRGWDIWRKVAGGWMLPDLVGVVNLNG